MKSILPKIIVFGISIVLFVVAAVQIYLGYVRIGKTANQQTISISENPTMFCVIVSIPILFGTLFLILALVSIFRKPKE